MPEQYVTLNLDSKQRSLLSQLRMGILPTGVETGRFNHMAIEDRKCESCDLVEVECHFLFQCELYNDVRTSWEQDVIKHCTDFQNVMLNI